MEIILTILGVIVTIVIGIVGVKYTFKQRKKTELTFLKNTCIYLFKAIVKNLDGIEIKFYLREPFSILVMLILMNQLFISLYR
jgi:hypothetical protein